MNLNLFSSEMQDYRWFYYRDDNDFKQIIFLLYYILEHFTGNMLKREPTTPAIAEPTSVVHLEKIDWAVSGGEFCLGEVNLIS